MTIRPKKRSGSSPSVEVSSGKVLASYSLGASELVGRPVLDRQSAVRTGRIHSATAGGPRVTWDGSMRPTLARVAWMQAPPDWSTCVGSAVILAFADGDEAHPIVLGLLDAPTQQAPATSEPQPAQAPAPPDVLRLESGRELLIECGKARIHLRADGKIEIRGEYLISRATGPNKIKGGSVQIN